MSIIKVSDLIINHIASLGVKHVFLIPGGANMHLVNSVANSAEVKYVCNHHEQFVVQLLDQQQLILLRVLWGLGLIQ